MTELVQVFSAEIPGAAPELIQLLPAGRITANDRRVFEGKDPAAIIQRSTAAGLDLPIDYEHQNDDPARQKNGPVPAAGWIKALVAKDRGIWARVEWTETARERILAKEYRTVSPAVFLDQATRAVLRIKGAGLVHTPALTMLALAREDEAPAADPVPAQPAYGEIAGALGLAQDAALPEILTAIAARDAASPELAAADAVAELLADRNAKAELLRQIEAERIVDQAICGAYFPPALRRFALMLCAADPELFQEVLRSEEPAHASLFETLAIFRDQRPRRSVESHGDDAAASIARQLGLDPETLR